MATLSFLDMLDVGVLDGYARSVVTFGEPRGLSQEAAKFYYAMIMDNHIRVVHSRDVVPHVPFEFLGFDHAPQEYWQHTPDDDMHQWGRWDICSQTNGEDATCSDRIPAWDLRTKDHMLYCGTVMCCSDYHDDVSMAWPLNEHAVGRCSMDKS